MFEELKELIKNAHSPYYNFKVATILICNDGTKFNGVNIETSSPAAGVCSERNAIYSAIASGYKKEDIKELHIMVDSDIHSFPCFICRQALIDFTNLNTEIFLYSKNKFEKKIKVSDLTVYAFTKGDLK